MELEAVLAALPARSPYREILAGLLAADAEARHQAYQRLRDLRFPTEPGEASTRRPPARVSRVLLEAAMSLRFPPQKRDWDDPAHELIFGLLASPHASLVEPAARAYGQVSDHSRCAILSLLGAIGTRRAAVALMVCLREHGWPAGVYPRVFTELATLLPHADVLFPELIRLAGPHVAEVTDVLTTGVSRGKIDLTADKVDLEPASGLVAEQLRGALAVAARFQRARGTAWRFAERYFRPRQAAGAWLDLAGHLRSAEVGPLLQKALRFRDPRLVTFAVGAAVRRGEPVARSALARAAACHETRVLLFRTLEGLGRLDLFPARFRTWELFAAADMVNWLMYPAELGREPDRLEPAAVFTAGKGQRQRHLYVWRFRNAGDPWLAGVSGAYHLAGKPAPLTGEDTFSAFVEWKAATAEEHAGAVLETLADWRRHAR